jgi:8-oxo-dGTP pyrophosphatase MutT (NUDIX family)
MDRVALERALAAYGAADPEEEASLDWMRRFAAGPEDPFARATAEGHFTGSALVARRDGSAFLLVLHRKLSRWLQPGGHAENADASVFETARREAREETGIALLEAPFREAILDVDVHPIPARGLDPAHFHFDVRYLFVTDAEPDLAAAEDPKRPMRWASLEDALALGVDASLARALRKARQRLTAAPAT